MPHDPAAMLRERKLRVTPQRRAILEAFTGTPTEHLSADEVLARATRAVPEVSRGTVYATLAELSELGLLAAVGNAEPVRYETNVDPHHHFRCRLCLRLFDVEAGVPDTAALAGAGYEIERAELHLDGVCADCRAFDRGLHDGIERTAGTPQLHAELVDGLACRRQESPVGPLMLAASPEGIVRLAFADGADFEALERCARRRTGRREARARVDHAAAALQAFFDGSHEPASDIVDWERTGTAHHAVLEQLRDIPYGEQRSYTDLVDGAGPYDVGYALGVNPMPILLPCHRITLGKTASRSFVGGRERLHTLTEFERASL